MELLNLSNDTMYCVKSRKSSYRDVLDKAELEQYLDMACQYPSKNHDILPEIYTAIPTGRTNKYNEELFERGDIIELDILNPKLIEN